MAERRGRASRYALRFTALAYLAFLLVLPVGLVFFRTFAEGIGPVLAALSTPNALHAFKVTLQIGVVAVICNTVFGLGASLLIVRHEFPGKRVLNALIDLPVAVSPVVTGLALILIYGRFNPVGSWFAERGFDIIFALPGMIMATIFVSLPLVARALVPVLEEIGTDQEQAARTLGAGPIQAFARITLPSIRWALAYGVVLTLARSLGEFGAVAVVSGRLVGKTQTLTLYVQERFEGFDITGAYAASFVLALIAIVILIAINVIRPKEA